MDRLQAQRQRLFGDGSATDGLPAPTLDAQGRTRTLVLGLARPADWTALSRVWQGVQQDAGLPAPAIAVSGQDALQLWFALAQPVAAADGAAWLAKLCQTYWADLPMARVQVWPQPDTQNPCGWRHAPHWPGQAVGEERWSAFIAPDLAPVFEAEPWLDVAPGADGQADLLARLHTVPAQGVVAPSAAPAGYTAPAGPEDSPARGAGALAATTPAVPTLVGPYRDAAQFLWAVVNDSAVPLALRIDAAKALLGQPPAPSVPT
jgi:hypothetical protein